MPRKKKCPKCGVAKEATTQYFAKHATSWDGLSSYCKKCRGQMRKRRHQSTRHRLKHHIAARVTSTVADLPDGYTQDLEKYLGYRIRALRDHLNSQTVRDYGMTLRDCLDKGFHVDHIQPLSSFDVRTIESPEFRECWAISNLRAIPAEENLQKGAKVA